MMVLDKGEINLIGFMGGDLSVVASARVSNGVSLEEASKGQEKDQGLINYLVRHKHETPFEHSVFTFYVKCPLFVRSEWMRHRIGSYNEISGRYVEFKPEFYIPKAYRVQSQDNKQGSIAVDTKDHDSVLWHKLAESLVTVSGMKAFETYQALLQAGVAKEMARMVLPLNLYTEFYWTVNARSLLNFIRLRNAPDAQYEIRVYAKEIEDMFKEKMPLTWSAYEGNNRL